MKIKVNEFIQYFSNNREIVINYHGRHLRGLLYTSQLAESSVNSVVNNRQKNKKMQWSHKNAQNILQKQKGDIELNVIENCRIWREKDANY